MLKIFSNFVFYLKNKKIQQYSKTEKKYEYIQAIYQCPSRRL